MIRYAVQKHSKKNTLVLINKRATFRGRFFVRLYDFGLSSIKNRLECPNLHLFGLLTRKSPLESPNDGLLGLYGGISGLESPNPQRLSAHFGEWGFFCLNTPSLYNILEKRLSLVSNIM